GRGPEADARRAGRRGDGLPGRAALREGPGQGTRLLHAVLHAARPRAARALPRRPGRAPQEGGRAEHGDALAIAEPVDLQAAEREHEWEGARLVLATQPVEEHDQATGIVVGVAPSRL